MRVLGMDVSAGGTCAVISDGWEKTPGSVTECCGAEVRVHGEHTGVPGRGNR